MLLKLPIKILLITLILLPIESKAEESSSKWYSKAVALWGNSQKKLETYADNTYGTLDIVIDGLHALNEKDLEALIPNNRSYYWWLNNQEKITAAIKANPLIAAVTIEACPKSNSYKCFALKIKERKPSLWVKAEWDNGEQNRFLIANDGIVLSVLKANQQMEALSKFDRSLLARFSSKDLTSLPILDARNLANVSDASGQLFYRAVELVEAIQEESGSNVYEFRFLGADEIEVEFSSQPYKIIFNIHPELSLNSRIAAQLKRLDKMLIAKPQLASRATTINLGLEREAYASLIKG